MNYTVFQKPEGFRSLHIAMVTQWFIELNFDCSSFTRKSEAISNNSTPVSVHTDFLFCIVKERGAK
ncbi:hypothetical protein SVI_0078 [Shewanella violacea DSS12]|uniref:Uncharacterized protein n=1 Tax=Shewanella violacea (strain JCM 10179 / CIP 106290 / LMG 19151 / DSS12) TaxID=637905 RepID=D4ZDC7_SHEVD|nr:hypothetical protein SVI_0078 [Shewanella violacea DSS12]